MFSVAEPRETKLTVSQGTSDLLYSWKIWSWKFIKPRCNGGRWSTFTGNSALLPSDVIDFAMLPAQRFWRETVSLVEVMWRSRNQWERALLGKIASYITKWIIRRLEREIWDCGESDRANRCGNHWYFPIFFYFSYKWVVPFTYITEANSVPISKPLSETSGRLYYSLLLWVFVAPFL